ncbi:MAG: hypothetical protein ACREK4_24315 [Candidatus Rokuibacteriota bacterium]
MPIKFPGDERPRCARDGAALLEPRQGFKSLRADGWAAFSLGRRLGLRDVGTHNPSSTLPGGGKSDHAYWPSRAFDLAVTKAAPAARARWFFRQMIERPEVEYAIFADKIWSRDRGLHAYTAGGHETHVHVSLRHEADV